jgi:(1->4)-alpha-D-glucan 1-alpha-D-glucosylmutase
LAGDVDRLAQLLRDITSKDRYGSDITLYGLKRALVEVLAYFPVYRTYVSPQVYHEADRELIRQVLQRAKDLNPGLYHELTFIEHALLLEPKDHLSGEQKKQRLHFIMRLQQLTGPLMAKGFEDTTLYVYNRRLSLNNVGGSPKRFGVALSEFHAFSKKRAEQWLHTMNATSTHDAKRGEDVRARINVLSEMPGEWALSIRLWSKLNEDKRKRLNGKEAPDRNDEYFLYQTLIGAFQENEYAAFVERVKNYIVKAVREAKVHTAWLKPDTDYEDAFLAFIEAIL